MKSTRPFYPSLSRVTAFSLIELLVVIAIIAVIIGLLSPALVRAQRKSRDTHCLNNLRQLGIAVRVYADDHDARLPTAEAVPFYPVDPSAPLARISDVLAPYVGKVGSSALTNLNSSSVFRCLSDKVGRFKSEGSSYEWNFEMNNRRIDETHTQGKAYFKIVEKSNDKPPIEVEGPVTFSFSPENIPLLCDYENFHLGPLRNSTKNVLFLDGHVAPLK